MGHLNGILARVGGNLNNNFQQSQMPGGLPGEGVLKLRFDQYINQMERSKSFTSHRKIGQQSMLSHSLERGNGGRACRHAFDATDLLAPAI